MNAEIVFRLEQSFMARPPQAPDLLAALDREFGNLSLILSVMESRLERLSKVRDEHPSESVESNILSTHSAIDRLKGERDKIESILAEVAKQKSAGEDVQEQWLDQQIRANGVTLLST